MPYIEQDRRNCIYTLDEGTLEPFQITSCGELNYLFTIAITAYISNKGLSYQTINDIIGALDSAKLEFYRRVAVPYEDEAIIRNGDVYNVK
jgi:hypothetical protein